MKKECLNPDSLVDTRDFGFSQIVVARPGKFVFLSGQVAWDEDGNIVGKNDLESQTRQSIKNLQTAIEAAGGTLENVTMLRIYIVNYQEKESPIISNILKEYFGTENPPASTWLNVQGLANKEFMIEIEAQAVI
ncbi:RidA family protein [Ekhidna sp.]|uniref:RidA family protein n=1 Tax=Ekhidna sp. TaxID=2608089 RepID=UPI003CCC2486